MLSLFKNFKNNTQGTVAIIFGVCLFPLVAIVGYAVDYNETSRQRSLLQSAVDLAALHIAKIDDPKKKDKAQSIADEMVRKIMAEKGIVQDLSIQGKVNGKTVSVSANANRQNSFSQAFGFPTSPVNVIAETLMSAPKIEVGLVLDNSGSMDGIGITSLREATSVLLNLLEGIKFDGENLAKTSFTTYSHYIKHTQDLSYNYNQLKQTAANMVDGGYTIISTPMLQAHEYLKKGEKDSKKFMIVLTDGYEEMPNCDRFDKSNCTWLNANSYLKTACPKVRADKDVTLYMIGLGSGIDPVQMKNCVQNDSRFYHVTDYSKLGETFKKIFSEIAKLRLTL